MKFLQRIGKSLMLPVAVLPICGILMGIGYWMCPASMQGAAIEGVIPTIGFVLVKAGGAIIDNMSWLFVIGVSVGMSDDNHGASCLSGLVSYLVVTTLLSPGLMSVLIPSLDPAGAYYLAFAKIQNPFIAIICGVLGAFCYNKYKGVNLPKYFSFFSGRRFVIIASALFSLVLSAVLALIWPFAYSGLVAAGKGILSLGGIGVGLYAFLNRLLIPFGLHHALNNVFWFDTIGIGDLTCFWSGMTSEEAGWSLGMYMSGFFPCMMFGVPGAALAMIKYAKNRKKAIGMLLSAAVCAFVCGVTEPFEFAFMFSAFPLYVVYSILYGVFAIITYYTGFRAGFSFSAGATDLLFSASLPAAQKTWYIIPLGIAAFAVFYAAFAFMLKTFNFRTPGNEADEAESDADEHKSFVSTGVDLKAGATGINSAGAVSEDEYTHMAREMLSALGGSGNLTAIDCCATRLRLDVKDTDIINHEAIKKAGAIASKAVGKNSCQIIIGVTVQQVCDALKELAACGSADADACKDASDALALNGGSIGEAHSQVMEGKERVKIGTPLFFDGDNWFETIISDKNGMHARPAGKLAEVAGKFESDITISSGEKTASLKSITEIMSLDLACGDRVTIRANGTDEIEAIKAIRDIGKV